MKHKKKKNSAWKIVKSIFLIMLGMIFMYIIIYGTVNSSFLSRNAFPKGGKVIINNSISENCQNLDLFDTAECLHKNVESIYNYNMSNVGRDLTFEELKQHGGVCTHYSSLYYNAGRELGFYVEEPIIYMNDYTGHIFTVISNTEGYCLLDAEIIQCFKFVNDMSIK